jgi:hypothetical protein
MNNCNVYNYNDIHDLLYPNKVNTYIYIYIFLWIIVVIGWILSFFVLNYNNSLIYFEIFKNNSSRDYSTKIVLKFLNLPYIYPRFLHKYFK